MLWIILDKLEIGYLGQFHCTCFQVLLQNRSLVDSMNVKFTVPFALKLPKSYRNHHRASLHSRPQIFGFNSVFISTLSAVRVTLSFVREYDFLLGLLRVDHVLLGLL